MEKMKISKLLLLTVVLSTNVFAESLCDIRLGQTSGIQVVEFATSNIVHSKMALRDSTADAILEEMISLQDMGVCEEKILSKKCILRFEKKPTTHITLFRGDDRWLSWKSSSKADAQKFVINLKRIGFCS
jgi:hypothetical protein